MTPAGHTQPDIREQIVAHPDELTECCQYLASCPRFGMDTEFVGEDTYHPHLCLVQIATPERLILIDPVSAGPLDCFWNLVTDPARQVIVHAGREEVRLCRLWTGKSPGRIFDLQIAAGLVGLGYPLGHAALVSQLLRVQLSKAETLTEWRHRPLTPAQIRYAYDDVRFLLPLWQRISEELTRLERTPWSDEEMVRLVANAIPEDVAVEKWRRLKGLGSLDRRRLAVVRDLYVWREETAARTNRPARAICRDDLLVEIARRNPTKEKDLQVIRGLPRRDLSEIIEVVRRGRALPIDQCPRPVERDQDPNQVGWVANVLNAVLGDLCVRRRLAPGLVATTTDVKLLVRSRMQEEPLPEESLLTKGWRRENVLPELLAVLDGKKAVRVGDLRAEAPFVLEGSSGEGSAQEEKE